MPSTALRKQLMANVRCLVVKVGTALLTGDDGQLDRGRISRLVRQVATLHQRGIRVTLVSSGAVGAGMGRAGLARRPRSLTALQATAAIGQPALMSLYEKAFARHGLHAGQILVTRNDFESRSRYVHICNTLEALNSLGAVPIFNENDTIAVDELDRFADNDTIAALVTNLIKADLMVLLTVVPGLLNSQGQLVDLVERDSDVQSFVRRERSALGSGGMASKLAAARLVTDAGECAVIANGREPNVLVKLLDGGRVGTIFAPAARKLTARKRWLAGAARPLGQVHIDAGAVEAVCRKGKSLLARGITNVGGKFKRGDIVRVVDPVGVTVAHGISNYDGLQLQKIIGLRSDQIAQALGEKRCDEVVHRDNLVITAGFSGEIRSEK